MCITAPYRTVAACVFCSIALSSLLACSASTEQTASTGKPLHEHEKTFDPSKYRDTDQSTVTQDPAESSKAGDRIDEGEWVERSERVMGYRIQLHSTTDIEEARAAQSEMHHRLDSLGLEEGRLNLDFDAPVYKLRYGDFAGKPEADHMRNTLQQAGITGAWVVRDRIIRIIRERK
jgi:hypothetical protein